MRRLSARVIGLRAGFMTRHRGLRGSMRKLMGTIRSSGSMRDLRTRGKNLFSHKDIGVPIRSFRDVGALTGTSRTLGARGGALRRSLDIDRQRGRSLRGRGTSLGGRGGRLGGRGDQLRRLGQLRGGAVSCLGSVIRLVGGGSRGFINIAERGVIRFIKGIQTATLLRRFGGAAPRGVVAVIPSRRGAKTGIVFSFRGRERRRGRGRIRARGRGRGATTPGEEPGSVRRREWGGPPESKNFFIYFLGWGGPIF